MASTPRDANALEAISRLMGSAMSGPVSLPVMADQLDMLAGITGYQSLTTLARGFREMHDDITNDGAYTHEH